MPLLPRTAWIGYDPRELSAFVVARYSLRRQARIAMPVNGVVLSELRRKGLYTRPMYTREGRLYDQISVAPDYDGAMSTEFAISRFLVPELVWHMGSPPYGWAMFMDCDMLVTADVNKVWDEIEGSKKAVYCVHHKYEPTELIKMDGQKQAQYARKNWTSVMWINCDHPVVRQTLTAGFVNSVPGRDLHSLSWLDDSDIGQLDPEWNYLVGHSQTNHPPKIIHFTKGGPWFEEYKSVPYANLWEKEFTMWKLYG